MKKKKGKQLDPRAQLAIAAVAPILLLVVGWMMLVGPQRSKVTEVGTQVESVQAQIAANRVALAHAPKPEAIRVADIYRLAKAMPESADMPGIILQLSALAQESGIVFNSITPAPPVPGNGFQTVQISLTFAGNFYGLSDFLYRLRSLVAVRSGELAADGRLFTVQKLGFREGEPAFPAINADLTLVAYVYGVAAAAAPTAAPSTATTQPTTTGTETTTETTTTDSTATTPSASASGGVGSTG